MSMKNLILHPTDISQWYALVTEAEMATHLSLNENTESYLVFLLQRFVQTPHMLESTVAMDFLTAVHGSTQVQIEQLKAVGDKSLLVCGLFPGLASRRHVSVNYYSQMGQSAYLTVSELQERSTAELYLQLSQYFPDLQKTLQAMRGRFFQFSQAEQHAIWLDGDESCAH
jgi:hypothetical protein